MTRLEPDTGAGVYTTPEPGWCDQCGTATTVNEDGWCRLCLADREYADHTVPTSLRNAPTEVLIELAALLVEIIGEDAHRIDQNGNGW